LVLLEGINNVGIKFASKNDCDFILLINNDAVVELNILNKIWFGGAKWNGQK